MVKSNATLGIYGSHFVEAIQNTWKEETADIWNT